MGEWGEMKGSEEGGGEGLGEEVMELVALKFLTEFA